MDKDGSTVDEHIRELPPSPEHGFVGRQAELRQAARMLRRDRYLVIRGEHGEGKTTLAAEIARRRLEAGEVERVAHVSLGVHHDGRGVRFSIGQQLVPSYRLAVSQDLRLALQLLERVLRDHPTLIIFDDLEAVLPRTSSTPTDPRIYEPTVLDQILVLASELRKVGRTILVFASVESLPEPFHENEIAIEGLGSIEAVDLVRGVLASREAGRELSKAQVQPLIDAVGAHAGSLVALAGQIAVAGLSGAARSLEESEAAISGLSLSERRKALALGAEMALRAMPEAIRRKLPLLGVFRGGGHLTAIAAVLELDVESDEEVKLAERLIAGGLADMLPNNYLSFHPALRAALRAELAGEELAAARASWVEATTQLVDFLCQEQIKSPQLAASLAMLDQRNLMACLEYLDQTAGAEEVMDFANAVESLVGPLGRPQALAAIEKVRDRAGRSLNEWTHEQYLMESTALEFLMDVGRPEETVAAARRLLHRAEKVGDDAYEGADYDLATIHFTVGLALLMAGEGEQAASSFEDARRRFHEMGAAGHGEAAGMEAQALARTGDAMRALGFRPAAAEAYRQAIEIAERQGARHLVAEVRTQVGELWLAQGKTVEALAAYETARDLFTELEEPRTVAGIWHQIGAVYRNSGQFAPAEEAYRQALEIELGEGDQAVAASTLGELGALQAEANRLDAALESYRRAALIFAELEDLAKEGIARSQMADKLIQLERYDDARLELQRTVECDEPFGHDAEPWRTYSMLARLEEAAGREQATIEAREKAIQAYLRYRRDGGESQIGHGEIFAEVTQAILGGDTAKVTLKLKGMRRRRDLPERLEALIPVLQAVLGGSRDPQLAGSPGLYYRDAAELLLQLELLEGARPEASDVVF